MSLQSGTTEALLRSLLEKKEKKKKKKMSLRMALIAPGSQLWCWNDELELLVQAAEP